MSLRLLIAFLIALSSISCYALAPDGGSALERDGLLAPNISARKNVPWPSLLPIQKLALAPLVGIWSELSESQQMAWMAVAKNYQQLSQTQRTALQTNMLAWSKLTLKQRRTARINFSLLNKIPEKRRLKDWERYMALSQEEKRRLAQKALNKKNGVVKSSNRRVAYPPYGLRFRLDAVKNSDLPGSPSIKCILCGS